MLKVTPMATAVALLSVAFACTSSTDDSSSEDEYQPPAMKVSLIQVRSAEGTNQASVRITNTDQVDFTVTAVRLDSPAFPEAALTPKDTTFTPGRTVDLSTTFGQPDCSDYPSLPSTPPAAEVHLDGSGDPVVTQPLDAHGRGWLRDLYVDACEEAALAAVADVRLADAWTRVEVDGTPYLRGWLELERVGSQEPVAVTSIFGGVLLGFRPVHPGRPLATLDEDESRLRIPVLVGSSGRCDAHGLSGGTQTFMISAVVRHGTAPAQRIILTAGPAVQDRALDVVHDACAG